MKMTTAKDTENAKRESHLARIRTAREGITDEQDTQLTAAALADPDSPPNRTFKRRGRPPKVATKEKVPIRLDPDVVAHFRSTGAGWQTRINALLRKAAGLR